MQNEHGGDIYRNKTELDFSICVNPLGMPGKAMEAAMEGLTRCSAYPDTEAAELREAIAAFLNAQAADKKALVNADMILPGNGAAELIYALTGALSPSEVILLDPGFSEYEAAADTAHAKVRPAHLWRSEGFRWTKRVLREILDKIDSVGNNTCSSLLFLCNPNNPTGYYIPEADLRMIAKRCEDAGVCLCVDECFLPFADSKASMLPYIREFPHLMVLRAFTKIYAMAGLRLGYLVSSDLPLLQEIRRRIQPWNVSIPAQMAGVKALSDRDYLNRTRELMRDEKAYLLKELENGLTKEIYGHDANYIFFRAEPGLKETLLTEGILIRAFDIAGGSYYRIGIRTHEENAELVRRWRKSHEK